MTEEKTQGLVLKLIDYKDADKLASVFTFDFGVVTAKFVGVKKEKAKMKAIAQPFTLANFNFQNKNGNRVVSNANIIDGFYDIIQNYDKTICGYILLDILKSILPENKQEKDLFVLAVSALKNVELKNEFVATIDFILKFLNFTGFATQFVDSDYVYLDKTSGEFSSTRTMNSVEIDKKVYQVLKNINDAENLESLDNLSFNTNVLKQSMRLLGNVIFIRFGVEIKSLHFI